MDGLSVNGIDRNKCLDSEMSGNNRESSCKCVICVPRKPNFSTTLACVSIVPSLRPFATCHLVIRYAKLEIIKEEEVAIIAWNICEEGI